LVEEKEMNDNETKEIKKGYIEKTKCDNCGDMYYPDSYHICSYKSKYRCASKVKEKEMNDNEFWNEKENWQWKFVRVALIVMTIYCYIYTITGLLASLWGY
jgi:hypothetical protein